MTGKQQHKNTYCELYNTTSKQQHKNTYCKLYNKIVALKRKGWKKLLKEVEAYPGL
jgi:hypothetical protein